MAPDFQEDNYFEAYIRYVEEHQRAKAKGQDPEVVEFALLRVMGMKMRGPHLWKARWGLRTMSVQARGKPDV